MADLSSKPKLYRLMNLGGNTMRMVSVENPAWHSCYEGDWVRADEYATEIERLRGDLASCQRVNGELVNELKTLRTAHETPARQDLMSFYQSAQRDLAALVHGSPIETLAYRNGWADAMEAVRAAFARSTTNDNEGGH